MINTPALIPQTPLEESPFGLNSPSSHPTSRHNIGELISGEMESLSVVISKKAESEPTVDKNYQLFI